MIFFQKQNSALPRLCGYYTYTTYPLYDFGHIFASTIQTYIMKKFTFLSISLLLLTTIAFSQKYKTAEDTIKLNKEYVNVAEDIASLTAKLADAQNKLPRYQDKAGDAESDAQKAAVKSREQSEKAVGGDVGDAKKAQRKAKQAVRDAKDLEDANDDLKDLEKRIAKLQTQLQKKQERLQEHESMRTAIRQL